MTKVDGTKLQDIITRLQIVKKQIEISQEAVLDEKISTMLLRDSLEQIKEIRDRLDMAIATSPI